jgi:predicted nucleic acid-binding protein
VTGRWITDTNVVTESARREPEPQVLGFLASQSPLRFASVTVFELVRSVQALPEGRKRRFVEEWLAALFAAEPQVLAFDGRAARLAAGMERDARRRGQPVAERDLFIAATAAVHDCGLATRNVADFRNLGVPLYDPFRNVHVPA